MEELIFFARSCTRKGSSIRAFCIAMMCVVALSSCAEPRAEAEPAQSAKVGIADAEESVRQYLENAVYTRVPEEEAAGEEICESAATYPLLALAKYRVLGSEMRGDTALVEAEVTSVATLDQHPHAADRYVIAQGGRTDTLHFALLRAGATPGWRICGYAREFIDFFGPNDLEDSTVEWRPNRASWQTLRTAVDSVRGASKR